MRQAAKQYKEAKKTLLERLKDDITSHRLKADSIIKELFSVIQPTPVTRRVLLRDGSGNSEGIHRAKTSRTAMRSTGRYSWT